MSRQTYIAGRADIPSHITLGSGERLEMTLIVLPDTDCDIPIEVDLDGEDAELDIRGLYLCGSEENVAIRVNVRHNAGNSRSSQMFKGIVGGHAKAAFSGLIYVRHDAQKIKAYQADHNILLTDTATVDTRPQLEIYADDVECSHGATIGRLNADELFYMRSRGIPEEEAKALQMISFIAPVLADLDDLTRNTVLDALANL